MRIGIRWKLGLFMAGLLVLTVAALSFLVLEGIERKQQRDLESQLAQRSALAEIRVRQTYVTGERTEPLTFMRRQGDALASEIGQMLGTQIVLYDRNGQEVGNSVPVSGASPAPNVADTLAFAMDGQTAYEKTDTTVRYFTPLQGPDGRLGIVQVNASISADRAFLTSIRTLIWQAGGVALLVSVLLGLAYFTRFARAIRKLTEAADAIRTGRYLANPTLKRRDEIGSLSEGIYYMSKEIERNFGRQKHFINNISHEFKTPLTSMLAYSDLLAMYAEDEAMVREASGHIRRESERLYGMVEHVLQLSALERYEQWSDSAEPVKLHELLADRMKQMQALAAKAEVKLISSGTLQQATVWADRDSLVHLFTNLIDNAIKYNVAGGRVEISLQAEEKQAVIRIRDTGIGIPEEAREQLFEPFYTVSPDRSRQSGGTGLGLSIVQEIVVRQGGTIDWEANGDNADSGVTFIVKLPLLD
ncbi:integral membrane sensor signal transduction histidine kinase [Paenibacillus curdlanolyticus YK9]|uniref:histidine kinase n=1 Tax=Paenibacillus curdlanolyticus YK9 TaxID=717606 RepID=E0IFV4_9BACL|nr:HAMP domain-containing sensor histidine kinase [Paenibacillus curdlanolyticus]EFM08665.1 integral membrane sensor signal transduction histidine kinase [Paenibacillus curdlanolyticus YK9]